MTLPADHLQHSGPAAAHNAQSAEQLVQLLMAKAARLVCHNTASLCSVVDSSVDTLPNMLQTVAAARNRAC